ncbi:hypothetical protein [Variovorax sp. E3]|uniref:hypothetical protein n=1 Tax=Variovorax sp. E3 TaxID=1914993 RepID=UPI0018DC96BF|nr:hypothetical protein [Variovorax sp. E3]
MQIAAETLTCRGEDSKDFKKTEKKMNTTMGKIARRLACLACCGAFAIYGSMASAQVPEIPDPSINDIAITTYVNGQIAIVWNPIRCNQMGLLVCRFFRAHEYGHVALGHLITGTHPQYAEFQADCYAAANAPMPEVKAAYAYFFNTGYNGNWSHGNGFDRAARIQLCAANRSSQ